MIKNECLIEFSCLSKELTSSLSKDIKKNNGIFFTPPSIIKKCIQIISSLQLEYNNILEPSCGSCEFVKYMDNIYDNVNIDAIENNELIFKNIKDINFKNNIKLYNDDFLDWNNTSKYNLIIGNPPYFVIKKEDIKKEYNKYYTGRPNIFIIFIIRCLFMLEKNGVMCFILPSSFMNCLYYDKLRKYIYKNYRIIDIVNCKEDSYIETKQETIILVIKNEIPSYDTLSNDTLSNDTLSNDTLSNDTLSNDTYTTNINDYTIFNSAKNIIKLNKLYNNSTTLNSINIDITVGKVVWNQHKDILMDDCNYTRLLYSSDISNNKVIYKKYDNKYKKNFIKKKGNNELCIVVNRGYGNGSYKFEYCLVDIESDYLIENHLIQLKFNKEINNDREIYNKILKSFDNEKTKEFIKLYFGNNAINTTELKYILPIYDI